MLKITAPRLVKNLREDVDWMDCISRQKDDFTGLMLEDLIDIGLEEMCAISDELGL